MARYGAGGGGGLTSRVLDGQHFPHIVDTIFDHMSPAALASASQVSRQWRSRAKRMFYQVQSVMVTHEERAFFLESGNLLSVAKVMKEARVLLRFSEIGDADNIVECFPCEVKTTFDPHFFPAIKHVRTWDRLGALQCVHHLSTPPTVTRVITRCECGCRWFQWPDVSRLVIMIRDTYELLSACSEMTSYVPQRVDSFVLIYLLDPQLSNEREWQSIERVAAHTRAFRTIITDAWKKGKAVTIVNAACLDDLRNPSLLDDSPKRRHVPGESTTDILRQMAVRAVMDDDMPPGPVCPVHFVTLGEYRDHVGELEYAIDTDDGWISRKLDLP